jgi:predicted metalloendopeptidase
MNEDRAFSFGYWRNQKTIAKLVKTTDSLSKFYNSCMKMHTIESQKESELEFNHIREIILQLRSYNDIPIIFGKLQRMGYTSPLMFSIQKHPISARNIPWLSWNGFDSPMKSNNTAAIVNVLERTRFINKYTTRDIINKVERVSKVLKTLELHDTDPLSDIVDYEEYLKSGRVNQDIIKYRDLPGAGGASSSSSSSFDWTLYFDAIDGMGLKFKEDQEFWVISRPYLKWLIETGIQSLELMDWRAYIEFSLLLHVNSFVPTLPSNVYFRNWDIRGPLAFEEHGSSGFHHHLKPDSLMYSYVIPAKTEDECVELTTHMLPGLVARSFLERAFGSKETKDQIRTEIREMTERILDAYRDLVRENNWLSVGAKNVLIEKINNVIIRVAEPDEWTVEPFEHILASDRYEHNMNLVRKYRVYRDIQLWHKDKPDYLDRNAIAFFATPLSSVNAYYSGPTNTITILAGILQIPFYQPSFNSLTKHAIIGSIIGHELGHLLDYNGLHWDKDGILKLDGIVDAETLKKFNEKAKSVVFEHNKTPLDCNNRTNGDYGNFTLNENIADLIGVRLSYRAFFEKTNEGKHASLGDKQHFFLTFAQSWCSVFETTKKCQKVQTDVHALPEYRVDRTLRNIPEFRNAFNCKFGDPMRNEEPIKIY